MPAIPTGRGRGRPPGSKNKRSKALVRTISKAARKVADTMPGFEGDAHAFLISVYKNGHNPLPIRIEAAGKALPYEKSKLMPTPPAGAPQVDVVERARVVCELVMAMAGKTLGEPPAAMD
jgi:hypothetical protein